MSPKSNHRITRITLTHLQAIDLDKIDSAHDQLALRPLEPTRVEALKKTLLDSQRLLVATSANRLIQLLATPEVGSDSGGDQ